MAVEQIAFKLSRAAIEMVRNGTATLTKGGIRDIKTGHIIELAKPVMTTALSNREMLSQISQGVKAVQALSWVNTALSLVNVGISVAGFYMTLKNMKAMHGDLRQFMNTYQADKQSETLETYRNHLQKIENHLSYLQSRYTIPIFDRQDFMNRRNQIEEECIETANFLEKTLTTFQAAQIEPKLACQIIFTLSPIYAQLVNEYCCQYYCLCGQLHNQFESWLSILDMINSEGFRSFMKMQMAFNADYAELHPQRRKDVLTVAFGSVEEVKQNLLLCSEIIKNVPENTLVPVENLLQEKIWQDISVEAESESPEEYMMHTIMQVAIDENDEEVVIPMRMYV